MLSARSALDDKLEGLELADDYMTKPFHMEELAKRVDSMIGPSIFYLLIPI